MRNGVKCVTIALQSGTSHCPQVRGAFINVTLLIVIRTIILSRYNNIQFKIIRAHCVSENRWINNAVQVVVSHVHNHVSAGWMVQFVVPCHPKTPQNPIRRYSPLFVVIRT